MRLLPRGRSVKSGLDAARLKMPETLVKLASSGLTGTIGFDGDDQCGVLCCEEGQIVAALWQQDDQRHSGVAALQAIFRLLQSRSCPLQLYRFDADVLPLLQQVCHGERLACGQVLDWLDVDRLLAELRRTAFTGALRLYSARQLCLIFYRDGRPSGFCPDDAGGLTRRLELHNSVALEPDGRFDLIRSVARPDRLARSTTGAGLEKLWLGVWRQLNP